MRRILIGLALAATMAPLAARAQYGGITPNAPYDQSRRVARRTARRTTRRNVAATESQPYYPQQPYSQPSQPYPAQPYPTQPYAAPAQPPPR